MTEITPNNPLRINGPHFVDMHVGRQLKTMRHSAGLSQEELANKLGITFQQVQKYEKGINRLSASRMYDIAHALSVPVSSFFMGVEDSKHLDAAEEQQRLSRSNLDLINAFSEIESPFIRKNILNLIRSLSGK